MPTLRDIRRRISSVKNTQQITNAMKMVSAAKLNRAQQAVKAAQPYSERLLEMVAALHGGMAGEEHPLFAEREAGPSQVILFTTDRGLCGNFNTGLCRHLLRELDGGKVPDPELVVFGRTGNDFYRSRGFKIGRTYLYMPLPEYPQQIAEQIGESLQRFRDGELSRVLLVYNHFYNPIRQEPVVQQLLPIPHVEREGAADDVREMLFEPTRQEILDFLLPAFLRNQALVAHLNTNAGEHGARMVAMEGATKNAGEMIDRLTLAFNRLRQAAITKELIEIVNGAQAL